MTARCDEISPLLGAFEDGELEPNEMQEVARHLARCSNCEHSLSAITTIGRMLRNAAPEPSLNGFADAVQSRIEHLRPPFYARLARWFVDFGERFGADAGLVAAGAMAALLALVIATPIARNLVTQGNRPPQVAASEAGKVASKAGSAPQTLADAATALANTEPSTVISQLESSDPDVAVWTGPRRDTTVIWLPDQQH